VYIIVLQLADWRNTGTASRLWRNTGTASR